MTLGFFTTYLTALAFGFTFFALVAVVFFFVDLEAVAFVLFLALGSDVVVVVAFAFGLHAGGKPILGVVANVRVTDLNANRGVVVRRMLDAPRSGARDTSLVANRDNIVDDSDNNDERDEEERKKKETR